HFRESFAPRIFAAGPPRTGKSGSENGKRDGCRRIRQLHKYLRMRSGLSRGDQCQLHFEIESRVHARSIPQTPGRISFSRIRTLRDREFVGKLTASFGPTRSSPTACTRPTSKAPGQAPLLRALPEARHPRLHASPRTQLTRSPTLAPLPLPVVRAATSSVV